jgi:hypothetical protein
MICHLWNSGLFFILKTTQLYNISRGKCQPFFHINPVDMLLKERKEASGLLFFEGKMGLKRAAVQIARADQLLLSICDRNLMIRCSFRFYPTI